MSRLLGRITAPGVFAQVRQVTPVRPDAARGVVAKVYAQTVRDFGMLAPPVILHSPAPPVLAAGWAMLRESLLVSGTVDRVTKELVAREVSAGNACPYCADVHGATLRALPGHRDARLAPAAAWARASATAATAWREPPVSGPGGAELVAVVVTFHYLNRMVNVFLGDSPLPPGVPRGARGPAMRLFGLLMRPAARRAAVPGASLDLLPAAPLPPDLSWAADAPHLAGAFAGAAASIEEGGRRALPDRVRALVADRVAAWEGGPAGLGRGWAARAAAELPGAERPAARLALLTALSSYQVDRETIADFLRAGFGERALVEATAWASLTAARRVGAWSTRVRSAEPVPPEPSPDERTQP
ncbi:carboxymuconolactone decarboxylase family protein [Thermostaphylospora chromogena]|uniref:Alkylhydroperoxidase AhpD family core domain-containing protein n=1 Tax=Thermostaphylospora chromogena TaxID=35622 RepID=A0A1H0ZSD8_9ACTN|nr:carboxymuconolactone decarboxylase family protein [Thermostaphylospora chromogena]SDQ30337.1 alkylhydroperoxidase AhpD family core domain-containing protein [Thermostaphylospora chromogena]